MLEIPQEQSLLAEPLEECFSADLLDSEKDWFSLDASSLFIGRYHLHRSDRKQQGHGDEQEEGGNFLKQDPSNLV